MDATRDRFAYRCLPLLIANQHGWFVLNSHPIRVTWSGGWDTSCIRIEKLDGSEQVPALTHFGHGVLTWNLPWLFRTPPGYNLLARGPANLPKDGIYALEGVVEADWSMATFTMNWQMTRPREPVTFEKDEPICMLVPQPRGDLENFRPRIRDVAKDPEVAQQYADWSRGRDQFLQDLKKPASDAVKQGWQKHYFQGINTDGTEAPQHQPKLEVRPFVDEG